MKSIMYMTKLQEILLLCRNNKKRILHYVFAKQLYLTFEEYMQMLAHLTLINESNTEDFKVKYEYFLNVLNDFKKLNIKSCKKAIPYANLTAIGINSMSNLQIIYWLDRGFDRKYFESYIKGRQQLNGISAIMRLHECDKDEAIEIQKNISLKRNITLNARPDLADINNAKGKSVRPETYRSKINPYTGLVYTEMEIKEMFSKRYGWRLNKPYELKDRLTNNCCIEFWLAKGFTKNEAEQELKKRQQTFSIETCIAKYGEKEGLIRWQERQDKWQHTLNSKSDVEKEEINSLIEEQDIQERYS